jgi:hypothetical protein
MFVAIAWSHTQLRGIDGLEGRHLLTNDGAHDVVVELPAQGTCCGGGGHGHGQPVTTSLGDLG